METNNIKWSKKELGNILINGERVRLTATVTKFDQKEGFTGPQRIICLSNIKFFGDTKIVFNSSWVNCGKWSSMLQVGNDIAFDARINLKKKRKIERITKVTILEKNIDHDNISDLERDLITKAEKYGKNLWERTKGTDDVILALQHLGDKRNKRSWTHEDDKNLEKLACKLIHSEWHTKTDGIISRLHEFVVWLKLMVDPGIQDIDKSIQKEFYRLCIEEWFYFYQGE